MHWHPPVQRYQQIKIVARHSGDAILRYVAEPPIISLRHELGRSATSKGTSSDSRTVRSLLEQLKTLSSKVELQDAAIVALQAYTSEHRVIAYVQNLITKAIHGQRAGDSSSTICGMKVGPARVKRGGLRFLNTIKGEDWKILCERCLLPERRAAIAREQSSIDLLADTPSKRVLDQ